MPKYASALPASMLFKCFFFLLYLLLCHSDLSMQCMKACMITDLLKLLVPLVHFYFMHGVLVRSKKDGGRLHK